MNALPKTHIQYTYDDYKLLPDYPRYELIEGDFCMSPAPLTFHQEIIGALYFLLRRFVLENKLGRVMIAPLDVVLSVFNVVQPDLLFVSNAKKSILTRENVQGAPDLVIEVLSPSTASRDLQIKRKLYAQFGVSEYWIVDPDRKNVEVLTWTEEGYKTFKLYSENDTLGSAILPDLKMPLSEVFQGL